MRSFKTHRGVILPLDRANVDTDAIIPKQFLKSIARTGFGPQLFFDWRYLPDGKPDPDFVMNQPRFKNASILVARNNFGCGSSREHAVWAIHQAGFQVVVAPWVERNGERVPAFADIFRNNSFKNSLLTIELSPAEVEEIFQMVGRYAGLEATVNLDEQRITLHLPEEISFHFELDQAVKERLIHGLDDIGITLKHETSIGAFEKTHDSQIVSA
ncbi:MAG TPA: 3-isopropylmalate dehydratase small subunit [Candidatus Omnitrophota bacterium]|nr:3-isopropylmalate dehydratase small subunit [Candidatus Omnitrophota bacterium]